MARTQFFHSCLGVFQGGGCRAAALVGAYEEAVNRGVQFIELAGTSAGSIIATLVGAGATPPQLLKFVEQLDFRKFLSQPDGSENAGFVEKLLKLKWKNYTDLWFHQGYYSSREIESWMESCLRQLLGTHQGPITFKMLPIPTSVVATDILTRKVRIWNQRLTPDESVAKAVRSSCSIPIFFQPVEHRYVDGGALSNLPTFVFSHSASPHPLTSRILAFALQGDDESIDKWGTVQFLSAVANTMVEGAQHLQASIQREVHTIIIPTGTVKATDFDKINAEVIQSLSAAGRKATSDFLNDELAHVKSPRLPDNICLDREDLYNSLTTHLTETVKDLVICEFDSEFVYHLFPTLFILLSRGARIRVILPPQTGQSRKPEHEAYRRRLIRHLGIELIDDKSPPYRGYLFNCHDAPRGHAYITPASESPGIEAVTYDGAIHASAIQALYKQATDRFAADAHATNFIPKLISGSQDTLLDHLKSVNQYSKPGVSLRIESVPISQLVALAGYVHEYKYRQVQHWITEFSKKGILPFDCAAIELINSQISLVTPPVVEQAGNKFVLIEGSTRATYLRDKGEEQIVCVVARGIQDPLPSEIVPFASVRVAGRKLTPDFRYQGFNYALFRNIERAAHPLNSFE